MARHAQDPRAPHAHRRSLGFALSRARAGESDISAARKLFSDALADEEAGRYAVALDEFERVRAVRDTQAVRYRIATCLEALGKLKQALTTYETTSIGGASDAESSSIARASRDKVEALGEAGGARGRDALCRR